jgi:hypothetical protein
MDKAQENLTAKYGNYHSFSLGAYLETLIQEVERLSQITLSNEELESIDAAVLRGLLKDDSSYKASLIHFADTNWKGGAEGHRIDLHFCFYLNPRTKNWTAVLAPDSGESSSRIRMFPLHTIVATQLLPGLAQTIGTRHLLQLKEQTYNLFISREEAFATAWRTFTNKLVSLSFQEKKDLFDHYDTLVQTPHERLTEAQSALQKCLIAQEDYERTLRESLIPIDPDISEIRSTMFGAQRDSSRYLHAPAAIKEYLREIAT